MCGRSHTHSTYLRFRKEVNENQETLFPGHHSAKPCCCRSTGLHAEEGSTLCLYVCIGLHKSVRLYIASIYRSTSARKTAFVATHDIVMIASNFADAKANCPKVTELQRTELPFPNFHEPRGPQGACVWGPCSTECLGPIGATASV